MDWASHFRKISFGANYDTNSDIVKQVQTAINKMGYTPALVVDGSYGPLSTAGVKWAQQQKGITVDGIIGDQTLTALGLEQNVKPPTSSGGGSTVPGVKISTVVAALKQAASEKGYQLNDTLLSLMIGQLRGAEGAYPGVNSSLGGTNNMGAAQVTKSLQSAKQGLKGWGAFAHKDSDPNQGSYIGWYWIAPTPLEAARHWFQDNWWGASLAKGNPQDATSYASILYQGRYFAGMHAGDPNHDPNSEAGAQNVADYAAAITRGRATATEMADPPGDINAITVDPTKFKTLSARGITEDLFTKAKGGGIGSAWSYLLPATWDDFFNSNGVVWFGPPLTAALAVGRSIGKWTLIGSLTAAAATLVYFFKGKKHAS